jgi:hypothetical protein
VAASITAAGARCAGSRRCSGGRRGTTPGAGTAASGSVSPEDAARRDDDPGPGPVVVGTDRCPYCSMSVIDARFAAQQVTVSGRVHVYDAIECLVDHLAGHGGPALAAGWCFVADHAASTRTRRAW